MNRKLRPLGDVLLDLEISLEEMIDDHDLQHGDVLSLIYGWLLVHRPAAREEYTDGTGHPEFYYGAKK